MVPARVKFARFRSVQKWTLLVFRPKSDSVPSKIFLSENILHRQNSISFPLMPFKKSQNLPFGRDGQKSQGRFDQKLLFFLFFRKKDIKTLFELCKLSRNFQLLKQRFSPPVLEHHIEIHRARVWSPPSNPSVCNFWLRVPIWEQLGNLFWRHFLFILSSNIENEIWIFWKEPFVLELSEKTLLIIIKIYWDNYQPPVIIRSCAIKTAGGKFSH